MKSIQNHETVELHTINYTVLTSFINLVANIFINIFRFQCYTIMYVETVYFHNSEQARLIICSLFWRN